MRLPSFHRWAWALLVLALHPPAARALDIPPWLPQYDLGIRLDTAGRRATVTERVTFTNRHARPAAELTFNVYPRYQIPKGDIPLLAKTLELLRSHPGDSIDPQGRHLTMAKITLDGHDLAFHWREDIQTALVVPLPRPVFQGERITVELTFTLELPEKQGRWGQVDGISFLTNWHPVLAYFDDQGWQPTPFIPWHQPFFNEAGVYSVRLEVPRDQQVASTGSVTEETDLGDGWKRLVIVAVCAREFSLVCSSRFQVWTDRAETATVRVLALPEHAFHAKKALECAVQAMQVYNRWFGRYPFEKFDIVEARFPWNANELSGMIMLDGRVFGMPEAMESYIDHLVSHETLHQWWYNVVGTNGYAETWMDEGLVCYFTARRLQDKYGFNAPMIRVPDGLHWLPNLYHENYRFQGLYNTLAHKEDSATIQPLDRFGNVFTLFSMTYDRGAKILGLIHERVGEAAFIDFMRGVYGKYQFRILRVADFQHELEVYTGRSWDEFFQQWLYGRGMTDWAVENVEVYDNVQAAAQNPVDRANNIVSNAYFACEPPPRYRVVVNLKQKAEFTEPTVLGIKFSEDGPYEVRLPIHAGGGPVELDEPKARIEPGWDGKGVRVEVLLPRPPAQVSVDPEGVLPERDPANNHWKKAITWRVTPLLTNLDENPLFTDYDRWNVIMGPAAWLSSPAFGQRGYLGLRAAAFRLQQFDGGVYTAYDAQNREILLGVDALLLNWPDANFQVGFQADHSITPEWATTRHDRGKLFGRYVFHRTASMYTDDMEFVEVYGRVENEFWRNHQVQRPGIERYDDLCGFGVRYLRNYLTPYWDPEGGYRFDVNYEVGVPILGGDESYQRIQAELAYVQSVPNGLGYLSETRFAFRVRGAAGWPDNGEHFQLGGPHGLRGLDPGAREGSRLWLGSVEWRLPIWKNIGLDGCDHIFGLNHLWGAVFYDAGAVYLNGKVVNGTGQDVGFGLRADTSIGQFIERVTLRLDAAFMLNGPKNEGFQIWVGISQPF